MNTLCTITPGLVNSSGSTDSSVLPGLQHANHHSDASQSANFFASLSMLSLPWRLRLISSGPHRWQNLQAGPFWQPLL